MIRLHNLIYHNTNLSDPWLRTVEHNSEAPRKESLKTIIYVIYQLISVNNYMYIFVKLERSKMSVFSNFQK